MACVITNSLTFRNSKFFCPKCNEEVPAKSCFKDRAAEGELKKVSLHCLNDGCGWCGPSSDYQTHKQVCELSLVSCHFQKYGCIEKVLQKDLSGHVSVCSFSPTRCQWCSELVPNIKVCQTAKRKEVLYLKMYLSNSCRII